MNIGGMEWSVIGELLGYVGTFLGGGWILSFYKAKPEKNALEIQNVREAMQVQEKLIERLEKRLDLSDERIVLLERRLDAKHEVIFSAYGCQLVKSAENECVVIKNWHRKCDECEAAKEEQ